MDQTNQRGNGPVFEVSKASDLPGINGLPGRVSQEESPRKKQSPGIDLPGAFDCF